MQNRAGELLKQTSAGRKTCGRAAARGRIRNVHPRSFTVREPGSGQRLTFALDA